MKRILSLTEGIAAFFLLLIALLTFFNVIARDVLGTQIPDWFDFSKYLQGIAIFWGIALATYRGSHISVDILWETVGQRGKRALDIVACTGLLALLLPMTWMIWSKLATTGTQTTSDLRIPLVYFLAVAAAGVSAAALLAAVRLARLARGAETDHG
ncbi:MAG: TRAP transporter small permease [Pseudomonadota bacterium]